MKNLATIIFATIILSACVPPPYEAQPPLNYKMNCAQILSAIDEANESLNRVKARRENVTGEEISAFILTLGAPSAGGMIAEQKAQERITLLQGVAMQKDCK